MFKKETKVTGEITVTVTPRVAKFIRDTLVDLDHSFVDGASPTDAMNLQRLIDREFGKMGYNLNQGVFPTTTERIAAAGNWKRAIRKFP